MHNKVRHSKSVCTYGAKYDVIVSRGGCSQWRQSCQYVNFSDNDWGKDNAYIYAWSF